MNKKIYFIIGCFPVLGRFLQNKINFWSMKCSPFMDEFTRTINYKILQDWMKKHPNKILTNKIAKKLLSGR